MDKNPDDTEGNGEKDEKSYEWDEHVVFFWFNTRVLRIIALSTIFPDWLKWSIHERYGN